MAKKPFNWSGHVDDLAMTLRILLNEGIPSIRDPDNQIALRSMRRQLKVAAAVQRALDRDYESRHPANPEA